MRDLLSSFLVLILAAALPALAYQVVRDWAQLPAGWHFGEVSGVDVDNRDNVWVFNRGPHPVIEFDKTGKMLQARAEVPVKTTHVYSAGAIYVAEIKNWRVQKFRHTMLRLGGQK